KGQKKPSKTFADEVTRLTNDNNNLKAKWEKSENDLKKARENFETMIATKDAEVTELKKKVEGLQTANLKDRQDQETKFAADIEKVDVVSTENAKLKKGLDAQKADDDRKIKRQEAARKSDQQQIQKLQRELTPPDFLK